MRMERLFLFLGRSVCGIGVLILVVASIFGCNYIYVSQCGVAVTGGFVLAVIGGFVCYIYDHAKVIK